MRLVYATQPTEMGDPAPFSGRKLRKGSASRWLRNDAGMSTPIHNICLQLSKDCHFEMGGRTDLLSLQSALLVSRASMITLNQQRYMLNVLRKHARAISSTLVKIG